MEPTLSSKDLVVLFKHALLNTFIKRLPLTDSLLPLLAIFYTNLFTAYPHLRAIYNYPPSKIRKYYIRISLMPCLFSFSAACTVIFVRSSLVWNFIRFTAQALAVHSLARVRCDADYDGVD